MAITSRDIMSTLDIQNVKTLTRWYQAGAIPKPSIEKHPGGIGRTGTWPDWVMKHCQVIKDLTTKGQTLSDIAATFGNDWNAIASRYQRRYVFSEASKKMDRDNQLYEFQRALEHSLIDWSVSLRGRIQGSTLPSISKDVAKQAIDLINEGHNPILVLVKKQTVVVPDFMVGHYLSTHATDGALLLVIPLYPLMKTHFATDLKIKRIGISPARKVLSKHSGKEGEIDLKLSNEWEFDLGAGGDANRNRKR